MSDEIIKRGKLIGFSYSIKDQQGESVEHSDMPISYIHGGHHQISRKMKPRLMLGSLMI